MSNNAQPMHRRANLADSELGLSNAFWASSNRPRNSPTLAPPVERRNRNRGLIGHGPEFQKGVLGQSFQENRMPRSLEPVRARVQSQPFSYCAIATGHSSRPRTICKMLILIGRRSGGTGENPFSDWRAQPHADPSGGGVMMTPRRMALVRAPAHHTCQSHGRYHAG